MAPGWCDRYDKDAQQTEASVLDTKLIDQLTAAVRAAFPAGLRGEADKHVRAALESAFTRLDLVTREEFEIQQAVLARTRAKLEQLEKQIAALEQAQKQN